MKSNYKHLGELVDNFDRRNKSLETSEVLGISIDKEFMPSVANTIGTDLSNYKLIHKNDFACNPMHVGRDERLPVSLYRKDNSAIVSPAYFMFRVKDEKEVLPEYLMLVFKRSDFDRNCWFRTDGSVRGGISWNDLCEIELPVPSITEQQKLVDAYNAIEKRIQIKKKINEKLEETAQAIYRKNTKEFTGKKITITVEDYCNVFTGKKDVNQALDFGKYKFFSCSPIYLYSNDYIYDGKAILVAGNGSYTGRTTFVDEAFDLYQRTYAITQKDKSNKMIYLICLSFMTDFQKNMEEKLHGSAIPYIVYDNLAKHSFELNPNWDESAEKIEMIFINIKENKNELLKLIHLKQLLITQLSSR